MSTWGSARSASSTFPTVHFRFPSPLYRSGLSRLLRCLRADLQGAFEKPIQEKLRQVLDLKRRLGRQVVVQAARAQQGGVGEDAEVGVEEDGRRGSCGDPREGDLRDARRYGVPTCASREVEVRSKSDSEFEEREGRSLTSRSFALLSALGHVIASSLNSLSVSDLLKHHP